MSLRMTLALLALAPPLLGLLVAATFRTFPRGRRDADSGTWARAVAAIGLVILLAFRWVTSVGAELSGVPSGVVRALIELRFALPLAVGVVLCAALALPQRRGRPAGRADLVRRTPLTYATRPQVALAATMALLAVIVALLAGAASSPDEEGRYRLHLVRAGSVSGGTEIFGWYFSVPCLVLLVVLVAVAAVALGATASSPARGDIEQAHGVRRERVRAVLRVLVGALSIHLGAVSTSLAGTAAIRVGFPGAEGGWVSIGTAFAALQPALAAAGPVLTALGFAAWFLILLPGARERRSQHAEVPA